MGAVVHTRWRRPSAGILTWVCEMACLCAGVRVRKRSMRVCKHIVHARTTHTHAHTYTTRTDAQDALTNANSTASFREQFLLGKAVCDAYVAKTGKPAPPGCAKFPQNDAQVGVDPWARFPAFNFTSLIAKIHTQQLRKSAEEAELRMEQNHPWRCAPACTRARVLVRVCEREREHVSVCMWVSGARVKPAVLCRFFKVKLLVVAAAVCAAGLGGVWWCRKRAENSGYEELNSNAASSSARTGGEQRV